MSLKILQLEKNLLEQVKSMKYEWLQLRMKVLCDHAFFKKLQIFQERLLNALFKRQQDQMLELSIQLSESVYGLQTINNDSPLEKTEAFDNYQQKMKNQIEQIEFKLTDFLIRSFNLPNNQSNEIYKSLNKLNQAINIVTQIQQKASRKEYDIENIPMYLDQIKEESKVDNFHFQTISEVEDYVYQVLHKHRQLNKDRKDASLEDLMAVTATENSQDLTNKIRQLIYMDNQRGDYYSDSQSDGMPSIIQETKNFANMFFNVKDLSESIDELDPKKIKKIEFSQSIKKEKFEKSLPFTHEKIDRVVFQGTSKNKEFSIDEAKKLLKKVVKDRKVSIQSEQSFEDPGIYTDRRYQELSSLPSTIDDHFANIQVELKPQKNIISDEQSSDFYYKGSKENLQDTVKRFKPSNKNSQAQSQQNSEQSSAIKKRKLQPDQFNMEPQKKSVSRLKIIDKPEDEAPQLRRDQSQQKLNSNPSHINLALKLRSKMEQLQQQDLPKQQLISQNQLPSKQQNQVMPNIKNNEFEAFIREDILEQQQMQKIKQKKKKSQVNNSVIISDKFNVDDDNSIFTKNKKNNDHHSSGIEEKENLKKSKRKNSSLKRQGSLPKIGGQNISMINQGVNQSLLGVDMSQMHVNQSYIQPQYPQISQKINNKKQISQIGSTYNEFINKYLSVANNQKTNNKQKEDKFKNSSDQLKRSKSQGGFNNLSQNQNQNQISQAYVVNGSRKNSASKIKGSDSNQKQMQRSKSTKKHQNPNEQKQGYQIGSLNVIGSNGSGKLNKYKSAKRLVILDQ